MACLEPQLVIAFRTSYSLSMAILAYYAIDIPLISKCYAYSFQWKILRDHMIIATKTCYLIIKEMEI